MSNTLRIRRSVATNTPSSLLQGELAFSEDDSPNGLHELFIGTASSTITKIVTDSTSGTDGTAAQPNSSTQDNQTLTTGAGISGADGGSSGNFTLSIDYLGVDNLINSATDLEGTAISVSDTILYHDATDDNVKKGLVSDLPFGVGSGDISRVNITAGTGLSGTVDTLTGDHTQTLALDFSELTDMTGGISGTTEFILQNGTTESRKAASEINLGQFNNDQSWTSNTGTVTSVAGGTGVTSSGGTTPSISLDFSELTDMTGGISASTEFIIQDGVTESRKAASEIALSNFDNDSGWTNNAGTVTSVTGGTGVDSTGGATPSLSLDLSELGVSTMVAGDWIAFDNAGVSNKALISAIPLSIFDNDSGWEANDPNEVLTTSTGSASWNWIIDEDAMGSDSAAHVPTQQSVKAYVDNAVSGALTHKGGYNAATNTPALDTGSPVLTIGDMYTVTAAGTFFTEELEVGDVLIADVTSSDAASLADWTLVQKNIGLATESTPGYVQIATDAQVGAAALDTVVITPAKLDQIDTLGTISTGTWQGSVISTTYLQNVSGTNTGDEPNASESVLGIIEIATQAEVDSGASALLAVTPSYLHNTTFDGGTF